MGEETLRRYDTDVPARYDMDGVIRLWGEGDWSLLVNVDSMEFMTCRGFETSDDGRSFCARDLLDYGDDMRAALRAYERMSQEAADRAWATLAAAQPRPGELAEHGYEGLQVVGIEGGLTLLCGPSPYDGSITFYSCRDYEDLGAGRGFRARDLEPLGHCASDAVEAFEAMTRGPEVVCEVRVTRDAIAENYFLKEPLERGNPAAEAYIDEVVHDLGEGHGLGGALTQAMWDAAASVIFDHMPDLDRFMEDYSAEHADVFCSTLESDCDNDLRTGEGPRFGYVTMSAHDPNEGRDERVFVVYGSSLFGRDTQTLYDLVQDEVKSGALEPENQELWSCEEGLDAAGIDAAARACGVESGIDPQLLADIVDRDTERGRLWAADLPERLATARREAGREDR